MRRLLSGSVLATNEYGTLGGSPVVALHGGALWEPAATKCGPHRRWICPSLRGFGASVKSPPWTIEQLAEDVVATLDSLRIERADVVGASLGGTVAFALAELVPARVRSVVVLDAAVCTPEHYLSHRNPERATPTMAALQKSVSENLPPSLERFTGHVLILAAGASTRHNVTESGKAALRSQLGPRLHAVTVADAAHNLLADAFDKTVSEIRQFLDQAEQNRPTAVETIFD